MLDETIKIKIKKEDKSKAKEKADLANMNLSEFTRALYKKPIIITQDQVYQKRVLWLLSNIANNVNQTAKHANTIKRIDEKVLQNLNQILSFVKSIDVRAI